MTSFNFFFEKTWASFQEDNQGMRLGQFFMNALSVEDLDLYRRVPSDVDPFDNDRIFPYFKHWLSRNWEYSPRDPDLQELVKNVKSSLRGNEGGEVGHCDADRNLCLFLRALGYDDVVDLYDRIPNKWYA